MTCLSRRIGIDIDGTIRDIYSPLVYMFKLYHKKISIEPIEKWSDYHIWNHFRLNNQPVNEQWFKKLWFTEYAEPVYNKIACVYPFAAEVIHRIKSKGHKIILISAQPTIYTMGLTLKFLANNNIRYNEIHFVDYDNKHKIDCDLYIEDSPFQINKLSCAHGYHNVWIYDQPWNADNKLIDSSCKRLKSWVEISKEIDRRFQ